MEEAVYSSVQKICSLLTDLSTVKLTLANDYFRTIVTLNRDALSCSYVENDYALALQIILSMSASLNTFCYLQHNFKVIEHIRRLKEDYEISFSEGVIVDKVTLYYDYVLAFVQSIGGNLEKRMPRLHIEGLEEEERQNKETDLSVKVDVDETAKLEDGLAKLKKNFGNTEEWPIKLKHFINKNLENGLPIIESFLNEIMMLSMSTESDELTINQFPTAHSREVLLPEHELAVKLFSKYRQNISVDSLKQVCNLYWSPTDSSQRYHFHQLIFDSCNRKLDCFYPKSQFSLQMKNSSFLEHLSKRIFF